MASGRPGKKLVNSNERCVDDFLLGFVSANNSLRVVSEHRIVVRSDYERLVEQGTVTVICGGGSGHEPAFAGYVGQGMLTACVAGPVFAAPPISAIHNAIRLVGSKSSNKGGCLVIVPNYTGDKLNFGMAIEKSKSEGYRVENVVVGEDCAVVSADKSAGRRGLAGIIVAIKVAGAMAQENKTLEEIVPVIKQLTKNLGTIGLCLKECSIPGLSPSFVLGQDEMELGLGVHGEAGVTSIKLMSAKDSVNVMFCHMTNPTSASNLSLNKGDEVVLLVNNLGATTLLELGIVTKEAISWLESRGIKVLRVFMGHVLTSQEMAGIGFTVIRHAGPVLPFLDAETSATAWPKMQQVKGPEPDERLSSAVLQLPQFDHVDISNVEETALKISLEEQILMLKCIQRVCEELIKSKETLNDLDRSSGDGDCGNTLSSGAQAILNVLAESKLKLEYPYQALQQLSSICQQSMGGASGAILGIFLAAACVPLKQEFSVQSWVEAVRVGAAAISKHGGADPGDRTLLDPLDQMVKALSDFKEANAVKAVNLAASSAESGAESTSRMKARAGRASYVHESKWQQVDPGAQAVAIIVRAIASVINSK